MNITDICVIRNGKKLKKVYNLVISISPEVYNVMCAITYEVKKGVLFNEYLPVKSIKEDGTIEL